jgi:hypothetical protein
MERGYINCFLNGLCAANLIIIFETTKIYEYYLKSNGIRLVVNEFTCLTSLNPE